MTSVKEIEEVKKTSKHYFRIIKKDDKYNIIDLTTNEIILDKWYNEFVILGKIYLAGKLDGNTYYLWHKKYKTVGISWKNKTFCFNYNMHNLEEQNKRYNYKKI